VYHSIIRRETMNILEASLASRSERTAQELLSLVCDAVITLNGSLSLETPSPALAALLFNRSPGHFCGVGFTELICCADRHRFRSFIGDFARPQCMHLHLTDADGGMVAVQLFHTRLEGLLGQTSHVIGIREESEGQLMREPPHYPDEGGGIGDVQHSVAVDDLVSLSSGASDCLECSCTVDAMNDELTLLECSPCFTAVGGPLQGGGMRDWIVGDAGSFHRWLVRSVNQLEHGDDVSPMSVILNPPHSRLLGPIRAVCHACEVFLDDDSDTFPVKIVLTDLKRQRWRKKNTGRIGARPVSMPHLSL